MKNGIRVPISALIVGAFFVGSALAEEITLNTYYPVPASGGGASTQKLQRLAVFDPAAGSAYGTAIDSAANGTLLVSGKVGIGTTGPTEELHIKANPPNEDNGPTLLLEKDDVVINDRELYGSINFAGNDYDGPGVRASIVALATAEPGYGAGETALLFKTSLAGASSNIERMRITKDGNVGIGGNIYTPSDTGQKFIFGGTGMNGPWLELYGRSHASWPGNAYINFDGINATGQEFAILRRDAGSAGTYLMTVRDTGNVGIGTTAPAERLAVRQQTSTAGNATAATFNISGSPPGSVSQYTALEASATATGSRTSNIGIRGSASGGESYNQGGEFFASGTGGTTGSSARGVGGYASLDGTSATGFGILEGGAFFASQRSSRPLTALRGIYVLSYNAGSGQVGSTSGVMVQRQHSAGVQTVSHGVLIDNPTGSGGTIGTNYGLYLENQTAGTTNYALYSAGGQSYFGGNVGIGVVPPLVGSRLHAQATGVNWGYGVVGEAANTGAGNTVGVYGISRSSTWGHGVWGVVSNAAGTTIGVRGTATAGYGGYFESGNIGAYATGPLAVSAVSNAVGGTGVNGYASATGGIGVVGSGVANDFYAVHGTYGTPSSIRWKTNIQPIDGALEKISTLRGVTFDWDEAHGGQHAIGMIAEEVGQVFPEIVTYDLDRHSTMSMDYTKLGPILIEAIKEQQRQIDALKAEVEALKQQQ